MGQRANLIIIENAQVSIRYDHWCANRLNHILFWGFRYAHEYFEAQDEVGHEGLLDEVWAEGGAVLDFDKKYLLWWGGEDILYDLPLRRLYLQMQKKVWEDWTVEWASRGIVDLVEYIGLPKEIALTNRELLQEKFELKPPENIEWADTVGCYADLQGKLKIVPLAARAENYLRNGIGLISEFQSLEGLTEIDWETDINFDTFPQSGFTIDEKNKTVEFWEVRDCPNLVADLKKVWDGWDVVWFEDRYENWLTKLNGTVKFPTVEEEILFERLRRSLLRETGDSGLSGALDSIERIRQEDKKIEINPWLFKSHHVEQPMTSKKQIWEKHFGEKND